MASTLFFVEEWPPVAHSFSAHISLALDSCSLGVGNNRALLGLCAADSISQLHAQRRATTCSSKARSATLESVSALVNILEHGNRKQSDAHFACEASSKIIRGAKGDLEINSRCFTQHVTRTDFLHTACGALLLVVPTAPISCPLPPALSIPGCIFRLLPAIPPCPSRRPP